MGASFINIELEVRASFELGQLRDALGENFSLNYCGEGEPGHYLLTGAVAECSDPDCTPDFMAAELCDLVENLSSSAREIWDTASDRVFDVGLDANLDRRVIVNLFSPKTIARIARVNARLAVSVYALDLEPKDVEQQ